MHCGEFGGFIVTIMFVAIFLGNIEKWIQIKKNF